MTIFNEIPHFGLKLMPYKGSLERLGKKWWGNVDIHIGDLLACKMNLYKVWTNFLRGVFFSDGFPGGVFFWWISWRIFLFWWISWEPKMVPYKSPCPDGRFDVRHAPTRWKLARNVPKMTVFGHFWPLKRLWRPCFLPVLATNGSIWKPSSRRSFWCVACPYLVKTGPKCTKNGRFWPFLASKTALAALFFACFCPQVSQILGMGLAHPTKL